ncbi:exported hypothetical protein [Candidatus Sulfopaludibacter sp. SbA6]|nr:exported hypothetical protein [Candidatus Sulfopaludibacter sp. SbA6]
MSPRLKWVLIGAVLALVVLAYWLDHQNPFPPVLRNQGIIA